MKQINCRNPKFMIRYKEFNYFATIDDYKNAFEKFKNENGHYPSTPEIDITPYFPTSRTIQRNFEGGVIGLRKLIGLDINEIDYRSGENRSSLTSKLNEQSMVSEDEVYEILINKFGREKIHRQEPYTTKINNLARSDFGLYLDRHFYIDIFIPYNSKSLYGCVSAKLRKFKKYNINPEVFLVIGNKEMTNNWINDGGQISVQKMIKKLPKNVKVISYEDFMAFINNDFVV